MACNSASNLSRGSFSKRAERLTSKIQKSLSRGIAYSLASGSNCLQPLETRNGYFEGRWPMATI
jgi:hypothetical protein